MKAWFVSDIHIKNGEDPRLKRFEDFLRARLRDGTTHLFLVGDIFDLWVGGDRFFAERFSGVVQLIRALKNQHVDVIYFEGNHDLHLQKFWSSDLGCRVVTAPSYFNLENVQVRVEHGDQMNPHDTGYLLLRRFLRMRTVEALIQILPGRVIHAIGNGMSRSSRKWTSSAMKSRNDEAIRSMIRAHAQFAYANEDPFDLIVSGHVHTRDDYSWRDTEGREVRSVNLGCWFGDEPPKAFVLENGAARWVAV